MTSSKKTQNLPQFDVAHKKQTFKTSQFFKIWTTRLPKSLEGLNSSLAQSPSKLCWYKFERISVRKTPHAGLKGWLTARLQVALHFCQRQSSSSTLSLHQRHMIQINILPMNNAKHTRIFWTTRTCYSISNELTYHVQWAMIKYTACFPLQNWRARPAKPWRNCRFRICELYPDRFKTNSPSVQPKTWQFKGSRTLQNH